MTYLYHCLLPPDDRGIGEVVQTHLVRTCVIARRLVLNIVQTSYQEICQQCDDLIVLFEPDSKCCKECLELANSCEGCGASLCEDCDNLECQACEEKQQCSDVCQKCIRECVYCTRDYCPEHLISVLAQITPCKECGKEPCLDKEHPKGFYEYVLSCIECRIDETEEARKRKRFFAPVRIQKKRKLD